MDNKHQTHNISPIYDENSQILILGSFPSVRSREEGFFYGHPMNRFWKVLAEVFKCRVPQSIPEKKDFLLSNGIALWDVIASCSIKGSSDSSISEVEVNDIKGLIAKTEIKNIFLNGRTAEKYYNKYIKEQLGINVRTLPSTSPANAAWSLERLIQKWREAIDPCIK